MKPTNFLTYPRAPKRHMLGRVFGPSHLGEFWRAVSVTNNANGTSRVGFVLVPTRELKR